MNRHNYARVGRFQNVNCRYALVNGIVFPSIYAAEEYCTREGLDANIHIQADDPAVLSECKRIATVALPLLREMQKHTRREWEIIGEEIRRKAAARDEAEKRHELGWEVHQDWVHEAVGKHSGFYECMKLLDGYINTLQGVLYIKD